MSDCNNCKCKDCKRVREQREIFINKILLIMKNKNVNWFEANKINDNNISKEYRQRQKKVKRIKELNL